MNELPLGFWILISVLSAGLAAIKVAQVCNPIRCSIKTDQITASAETLEAATSLFEVANRALKSAKDSALVN